MGKSEPGTGIERFPRLALVQRLLSPRGQRQHQGEGEGKRERSHGDDLHRDLQISGMPGVPTKPRWSSPSKMPVSST